MTALGTPALRLPPPHHLHVASAADVTHNVLQLGALALVQGTPRAHSRSRNIGLGSVVVGLPLYSAVLVRTATPVLQCLISCTALLYMMGRPLHKAATRRTLPPARTMYKSQYLVLCKTPVNHAQCLMSCATLLYMMGRPLHNAAIRRTLPPASDAYINMTCIPEAQCPNCCKHCCT